MAAAAAEPQEVDVFDFGMRMCVYMCFMSNVLGDRPAHFVHCKRSRESCCAMRLPCNVHLSAFWHLRNKRIKR